MYRRTPFCGRHETETLLVHFHSLSTDDIEVPERDPDQRNYKVNHRHQVRQSSLLGEACSPCSSAEMASSVVSFGTTSKAIPMHPSNPTLTPCLSEAVVPGRLSVTSSRRSCQRQCIQSMTCHCTPADEH